MERGAHANDECAIKYTLVSFCVSCILLLISWLGWAGLGWAGLGLGAQLFPYLKAIFVFCFLFFWFCFFGFGFCTLGTRGATFQNFRNRKQKFLN